MPYTATETLAAIRRERIILEQLSNAADGDIDMTSAVKAAERMMANVWSMAEDVLPATKRPDRPKVESLRDGQNALRQIEAALIAAGSDPAGSERAEGSGPERRRRRGRPLDTDAKKDKRIYDAWRTGKYRSHAELASALQLKKREAQLAIERHRKRLERGTR